jgi:hypothetical protein
MFYKTSPNEKGAKSVFTDMADFFLFFSPSTAGATALQQLFSNAI